MALNAGDYLKWFNDEITRYRNLEWQAVAYSTAILGFIAAWATDHDKKRLIYAICPSGATIIVALMIVFCLFVEVHFHKRLNDYRAKQNTLLSKPDDLEGAKNASGPYIADWIDFVYIAGFLSFIGLIGSMAIYSIWQFRGF